MMAIKPRLASSSLPTILCLLTQLFFVNSEVSDLQLCSSQDKFRKDHTTCVREFCVLIPFTIHKYSHLVHSHLWEACFLYS